MGDQKSGSGGKSGQHQQDEGKRAGQQGGESPGKGGNKPQPQQR
jgi:hypothetical protein